MIDRNSPLPIYYQLKDLIKRQIQSGTLHPGDRLPTAQVLCQDYGISRAPVRQALTELVQEGYIYRRPGQGTFVAPSASRLVRDKAHFHLLANDVRWVSLLERAIHHWNTLHPNQEVILDVDMPEVAEFHNRLRSSAVQGKAPDLVALDYVWMATYARSGYLTPFDDLDKGWVAELRDDLEPPVAENHTIEGYLYGLPMQADVTGLWYRKDWFAAEGLVPPETWAEWHELLVHFAQPDVRSRFGYQYPVAFPVGVATGEATVNLLLPFIWSAGGDLLDANGKLVLNSANTREALHYLQDIAQKPGYLPSNVLEFKWWSIPRLLAQGKLPMALGGTYEWPVICEESGWDSELDLFDHLGFVLAPRPSRDQRPVTSLGGTTWVILHQSNVQALSLELLRLATAPDILGSFCEETFQIAPLHSINQRVMTESHPWLREVVPLLEFARPRPMLGGYVRVSRFLQRMFESILWDGASVEEVVLNTHNSLQVLLG